MLALGNRSETGINMSCNRKAAWDKVNAIRPTHFTYHVTRKLPCLVITTDVSVVSR